MDKNIMDIMSGLMNNPEAVGQIRNILDGIQKGENDTIKASKTEDVIKNEDKPQSVPDMSFLSNIFTSGNQNTELMVKMKNAYDAYANNNDPEINLLTALSPYLSAGRLQSAERMKTLIKIGKATSAFTKR